MARCVAELLHVVETDVDDAADLGLMTSSNQLFAEAGFVTAKSNFGSRST